MKSEFVKGNIHIYNLNDVPHRSNGPAIIHNNGRWNWFLFGNWHRYYGPQDSIDQWWVHGERLK